MMGRMLTAKQAADYLGYSVHSLARFRQQGLGPAYNRRAGAVVYAAGDLDAWLASRRVVPGREFQRITMRAAEALKPVLDQALAYERDFPELEPEPIFLSAREREELLSAFRESRFLAEGVG
jgi:hypothetical protein